MPKEDKWREKGEAQWWSGNGFVENEDNRTSHNNKIYKVNFLQLNQKDQLKDTSQITKVQLIKSCSESENKQT